MEVEFGIKYTSFIHKLDIIRYFYEVEHLSFEEISIIVNSYSEIIQLYYEKLLN